MKSTESLADNATRLLGIARSSPQAAQVQRDALLASFLLASPPPKTTRGGRAGGQRPPHRLPESNLVAGGMMQKIAARPGASATVRHLHPPSG